jgi:hypothetical protein
VRDLGGELADGGELGRLAQVGPRAPGRSSTRAPGLGAGVAQRLGHLVEARRQRADLVLALGEQHVRQVALGHVVDAGDELADRGADAGAGGQRDGDDHHGR